MASQLIYKSEVRTGLGTGEVRITDLNTGPRTPSGTHTRPPIGGIRLQMGDTGSASEEIPSYSIGSFFDLTFTDTPGRKYQDLFRPTFEDSRFFVELDVPTLGTWKGQIRSDLQSRPVTRKTRSGEVQITCYDGIAGLQDFRAINARPLTVTEFLSSVFDTLGGDGFAYVDIQGRDIFGNLVGLQKLSPTEEDGKNYAPPNPNDDSRTQVKDDQGLSGESLRGQLDSLCSVFQASFYYDLVQERYVFCDVPAIGQNVTGLAYDGSWSTETIQEQTETPRTIIDTGDFETIVSARKVCTNIKNWITDPGFEAELAGSVTDEQKSFSGDTLEVANDWLDGNTITVSDALTTYTKGSDYKVDVISGMFTRVVNSVNDEQKSFSSGTLFTNYAPIEDPINITDDSGSTTYQEGSDYNIVSKETGKIERVSGGAISSGETVIIDYDWANIRPGETVLIDYDYNELVYWEVSDANDNDKIDWKRTDKGYVKNTYAASGNFLRQVIDVRNYDMIGGATHARFNLDWTVQGSSNDVAKLYSQKPLNSNNLLAKVSVPPGFNRFANSENYGKLPSQDVAWIEVIISGSALTGGTQGGKVKSVEFQLLNKLTPGTISGPDAAQKHEWQIVDEICYTAQGQGRKTVKLEPDGLTSLVGDSFYPLQEWESDRYSATYDRHKRWIGVNTLALRPAEMERLSTTVSDQFIPLGTKITTPKPGGNDETTFLPLNGRVLHLGTGDHAGATEVEDVEIPDAPVDLI